MPSLKVCQERAGFKAWRELFSMPWAKGTTEEGTYIGMYRHNVETIYHALTGSGD